MESKDFLGQLPGIHTETTGKRHTSSPGSRFSLSNKGTKSGEEERGPPNLRWAPVTVLRATAPGAQAPGAQSDLTPTPTASSTSSEELASLSS